MLNFAEATKFGFEKFRIVSILPVGASQSEYFTYILLIADNDLG
jgi:hypothetical protein